MSTPLFQVDAFTSEPFAGNPAGVAILDVQRDPHWMQAVAAEMNLPETAFVTPRPDGDHDLRWFTPKAEVDLCGHATLATSHVLWTEGIESGNALAFHTKSGVLRARRSDEAITLDLPAGPVTVTEQPAALEGALGTPVPIYARNDVNHLAELSSEEEVRALTPDIAAVANLGLQGLIVTAQATSDGIDFVSRYFAPNVGIDEDPVTGAAHCTLGPWWYERTGRAEFSAYQASARGGYLGVRVVGDRVELTGHAVTVFRAELA